MYIFIENTEDRGNKREIVPQRYNQQIQSTENYRVKQLHSFTNKNCQGEEIQREEG